MQVVACVSGCRKSLCVHPLLAVPAAQVESAADIAAADKLVFPGVGAFGQAMHILQQRGYVEALRDYIHVRRGGLRSWCSC